MDHKSFEIFVPSRYASLILFPFCSPNFFPFFGTRASLCSPFVPQFPGVLSDDYFRESRYSRFRSFEETGQRAQATRLERNDGSNVTASGLGLNSHYTTLGRAHSTVRTSQDCVPRTYRRMRERWCLTHIRRPLGQLEAPTSSCQLRVANLTWSTLLKSHRAARHLLAQLEAGGQVPTF